MADRSYAPPWSCSFSAQDADDKPTCLFCGNSEGVVLLGPGRRDVGVCEGCTTHAHWVWKLLPGDAPPRASRDLEVSPTRIKLLVTRLQKLSDGQTANPGAVDSYEFALSHQRDGELDLPTVDLRGNETEADAVSRLCGDLLIATWPVFVEPLYVAHTPRGRLVRIVLITAYAEASISESPRLVWREWPLDMRVAPAMREFYVGFRDVWGLRLWKHQGRKEPRTSEITTLVREGAWRYIRLQQRLRAGSKDGSVDTSMAEYLYRSMSDDEKLVEKMVRDHETRHSERTATAAVEKVTSAQVARGPVMAESKSDGGPPPEISLGSPPDEVSEVTDDDVYEEPGDDLDRV